MLDYLINRPKACARISASMKETLTETRAFLELLEAAIDSLRTGWRNFFASSDGFIIGRAPGRLDLMGGIADYSGSLVLQWPIQSATHVAVQRNRGKTLRIASLPAGLNQTPRLFEMQLDELTSSNYSTLRSRFSSEPEKRWAAYVAGIIPVLVHEKSIRFSEGADILISSTVPEGKGVSSSAALEVASMQALAAALELSIQPHELALLCQKVENLLVGAPCGVMDQMTAACGEANHLLELLCQPAELRGTISLPEELEIWGIDSGIRHSVSGSDYRMVRTAAFMGYRIIAQLAGLSAKKADGGHVVIDDSRWHGYLANISPWEFARDYAPHIPESISGKDFLDRYRGTTDTVTSVDPSVDYPVLAATRHPIFENARVNRFGGILKNWKGGEQSQELGELMYQSHESYSSCGLGSDGTDALVELVRHAAADGLFGAKITGGGSGGTVAILGRRGANGAVRDIAARYREYTGYEPLIISGSSPGASSFGYLKIRRGDRIS